MKKAKFKSLLSIIILILIWSNTIGQSYPILEVRKDSIAIIPRSDLILLLNESGKIKPLEARCLLADNYINLLEKSQAVKDSTLRQANFLIVDYSLKLDSCSRYAMNLGASINKIRKQATIKNYVIIGLGFSLLTMIIFR